MDKTPIVSSETQKAVQISKGFRDRPITNDGELDLVNSYSMTRDVVTQIVKLESHEITFFFLDE